MQRISQFLKLWLYTETFLDINSVKCVQYLGLLIDENLYWHMHVEHGYDSLVKYFGILNYVKTMVSKKIARQLYFAFIHSRIRYGIEGFWRLCKWVYLKKLQVIQNKLLKLLLNFEGQTSNNEYQHLCSLKVADVLSFVDECRSGSCPNLFASYYHVREGVYDLRQNGRLHVPMARTGIGKSCFKIKGARLWDNKSNFLNQHLYKKCFRTTITMHYIETYQ